MDKKMDKKYKVDLGIFISRLISSRDIIDVLFNSVPSTSKTLVLDFKDVEFITRSAAHQLILKINEFKVNKNLIVQLINKSDTIDQMLEIVKNDSSNANRKSPKITRLKFNSQEEFDQFLAEF